MTTHYSSEFTQLITQHAAIINKVCYIYANTLDDFNDMRQETLINIWRGLPSFRHDSSPSTWVYRVALNSCVSFFLYHWLSAS